ncbi:TetR/AcrR family transcriptional regulator [Rhodococcus sp. IEGM 1330]|uniref:TetR/AcrR family transcriptional regulator n=1 Tax=Rhodococcus sp. IEGM 1330 TaxID=3082225 RepID=UPI002955CEC5|nr:TetR/AcrR family transcriptional regulator [Rhodococcus sp. IEGM 1330]MDV8022748.1 TetR/AcrR family transcriptional regulator [Rhodococcus sp. IEGM 1330]
MTSRAPGRSYSGLSPDARREQRRELFLASGLELFGTLGYRKTTVRRLSDHSGVAARYLAESFDGSAGLFGAVYDRIHQDMVRVVQHSIMEADPSPSSRLRAGASALLHAFTSDSRVARIKLVEAAVADPEVAARQRSSVREIAAIIEFCLPPPLPHIDIRIVTRALAGAVIELIVAHHDGELEVPNDRLVDHMVALCEGVATACCE